MFPILRRVVTNAPRNRFQEFKGWVVIPAQLCAKHGHKPGSEVRVVDYAGVLSIVPVQADPIAAGLGLLRGPDSLTAAVVAEHQYDRRRE